MTNAEEVMCRFLEQNEQRLLDLWMKSIIATEDDRALIYENGKSMCRLVTLYLRKQIDEERILMLAYKVAQERVQRNVNIGEFVWNVSLGRSVILHHLYETIIPLDKLQPIINQINECFDTFLHHAVRIYTELKNSDLEEKKQFIEQTHKERLTILGQLSASFVHEIRNPLTAVMGFVKLLQRSHPALPYLDIIQHELDQLNFRVSQFLLVSRKSEPDRAEERFELLPLMQEILEFIYPSIAYGEVEVAVQVEEQITLVGLKDEIKQVFINLILNAIDALQEVDVEKRITIQAVVNEAEIQVSIENNGPAIPAHMTRAIFEPFVTTKDLGTGLGLFICKKIVEKQGGTIECESNEQFTRFTLHFAKR